VCGMDRYERIEDARGRYERARARYGKVRNELRLAVLAALDGGMSEAEAAREAGVSRMTVRAWRHGEAPTAPPTNV
jgi:transposase-like protein